MELNKITNLINYIDSEMTGVKDKILEIDKVVFQVDSKTKNSGLLGLESKKVSLLREYDLLLTRYGKLVEKRREILDPIICDLTKKGKQKTKFTYDDYLKMSKEERDNIGGKEWHDLKPEDRMLIIEDWGFGDDIEGFEKNI